MFEQLENRLSEALRKVKGLSQLTDANMADALREVRQALLEADVSLDVVKTFIEKVKAESKGAAVLKSLSPGQQIIKIVYDELVNLLGGQKAGITMAPKGPTVILMAGLQGSGKTTSTAKLALHLQKEGYRPLLVSADVYRPAAREQLTVLGNQLAIPVCHPADTNDPLAICRKALAAMKGENANVLLVDTAGRLQVDEDLMVELEKIKKEINPAEILFVADAMMGRQAADIAHTFHQRVGITGVVLTKLDGDARGGAALSIKSVAGAPVKFCGVGEKPEQFEVFHPDRMASRILGMGDVLSLIEKAQEAADEEEAKKLERKMSAGDFDLNDFLKQLAMVKKMGPIDQLMGMIPGVKIPKGASLDNGELGRIEAIINSMTKEERRNYTIINGSRKERIAEGSGTEINDVNRLLKQFAQMKKVMKNFKKGGGMFNMPAGPGMFGR
ncbi:MAG: signal recognition particle protein [Nitrospinae bacterium]|nr:signal recognition particle protein [Nitrospinota bacterium]